MALHKPANRCAANCGTDCDHARRAFLKGTALALASPLLTTGCSWIGAGSGSPLPRLSPQGPASRCTPVIKAAFVRRKGDDGMAWPGAVYDGEAARQRLTEQTTRTAARIGARLDLRPQPIYSTEEADAWIAEALEQKPDGLLVLLLDRQQHAWPTAGKAAHSGIPAVIYSPLGSSFTVNTEPLAETPGCVIFSTDDTRQLDYGMKMLAARARMRQARCVVIAGKERRTGRMPDLGIELQYVPAAGFLEAYNALPDSPEIQALADDYIRRARRQTGATRQDVVNGVKSYDVARQFLERENGDAITMDCLGALGASKVSLPCIAWSRMNDDGIPAACEADLGAVASHIMVQYLFDRPGFQQDPVADTADDTIIGAHCSCATRLNGFEQPGEPFDIIHHHGNRDAVPRTLWAEGQRVTCLDVLPGQGDAQHPTELLISTGSVARNIDVPPAGGCVVSVKLKLDGERKVLSFPGFHQLFFYGDYGRELEYFSQLCGLKARQV